MSFARDIGKGVQVPQARGPVQYKQSGSSMGDLANATEALAGIYAHVEAKGREKEIAKQETSIAQATLKFQDYIMNERERTGGSVSDQFIINAQGRAQAYVQGGAKNVLAFREATGKWLGGDFAKTVVGEALSAQEQTRAEVNELSPEVVMQSWVAMNAERELNGLPPISRDRSQWGDDVFDDIYAHSSVVLSEQAEAKAMKDKFINTGAAEAGINAYKANSAINIGASIKHASVILSEAKLASGESGVVEAWQELRNTFENNISQQTQYNMTERRDLIQRINSNPKLTTAEKQASVAQVEAYFDNDLAVLRELEKDLKGLDAQQFKKFSELASFYDSKLKYGWQKAAPVAHKLKVIGGDDLITNVLVTSATMGHLKGVMDEDVQSEIIRGISSNSLVQGDDMNVGSLVSAMSHAPSYQSATRVLYGDEWTGMSEEEIDAKAASDYEYINAYINDQDMMTKLADPKHSAIADNMAFSIIRVFDRLERRGNPKDKQRVASLIANPMFKQFATKVIPEAEREAVGTYIASAISGHAEELFNSYEGLSFSADTGEVTSANPSKTQYMGVPGSDRGGYRQIDTPEGSAAKQLDKKLNAAASILAETDEYFGGDEALAKQYLVSTLPKERRGDLSRDFQADFRAREMDRNAETKELSELSKTATDAEKKLETITAIMQEGVKTGLFRDMFKINPQGAISLATELGVIDKAQADELLAMSKEEQEEWFNAGTTNTDS